MKLKNKMALCMALVSVLFTVAVAMAITGMRTATARFDDFIRQDQAFLTESNTLYAQGLQMGQALRNVILAPAEPKGYANLKAAREAFRAALPKAQALAQSNPTEAKALAEVAQLHARQAELQEKIVELAKQDQPAAIALLNSEETPTWRQMRATLLDLIKAKNDSVEHSKASLAATTQRLLVWSLALAAIAIMAGIGIAFWLTRSVMHQLGGEPDYAAGIAATIASGDLTSPIVLDRGANRDSLLAAMQTMQASLSALVHRVRQGTDTITTAATEIAAGNIDLSSRTEEQASSLEETASSMEELTSTVQHNAESIRQANELATQASSVARKGGGVVDEVVSTMDAINQSARRIVDIIAVIDGIAFQTNILALNAAVEAARAGEQGRGFAVVASEVRNLAQRSATAAKEIKELINDSTGRVEEGSKLANLAGQTMSEVVDSVQRVTAIMGEIALAGQEQSAGIAQVNQAIAQMDQVTQQNAALVEEAAAAADSMQAQARELLQTVDAFKVDPAAAVSPRRAVAASRERLALAA